MFFFFIYLTVYVVDNVANFQTNMLIHDVDTKTRALMYRPVTNLTCFRGVLLCWYIFTSLPTRIRDDEFHFKVILWKYLLLILFIQLLNFRCIESMSLMVVICKFNLYFVICGLWFSYSNHLKLCYMFDILLCDLKCVILSCFVSTCILYYCDLFHIRLSCNSFDLQNVCVICFILLCNLNCVILSCFVCTCALYYCDFFHIWLSCDSFDLQNVCTDP